MAEALLEVKILDATCVFMMGEADEIETVDNLDAYLIMADDSRWCATIFTLAEVDRLMHKWEGSDECLSGRYFRVPDALITQEPGLDPMIDAVEDLLHSGRHSLLSDLNDPDPDPEELRYQPGQGQPVYVRHKDGGNLS